MKDKERIISLATKRFTGEITRDESDALDDILKKDEAALLEYQQLERKWHQTGLMQLDSSLDLEQSWKDFKHLTDEESQVTSSSNANGKMVSIWWQLAGVAAVIFAVVGSMLFFIFDSPMVYETADQSQQITLPDGSEVTLQPHSTLTLDRDFYKTERLMKLEGVAFFEVVRDESKVFSVYAGETVTRVLGTSFTIKSREIEQETTIAVHSGKVSFGTAEEEMTLVKDMVASYNGSGTSIKLISHPALRTREHLEFDNMPLSEVIVLLKARFDANIELDHKGLENCRITASVKRATLSKVLKIIEIIIDVEIEESEGTYLIKGKGCA